MVKAVAPVNFDKSISENWERKDEVSPSRSHVQETWPSWKVSWDIVIFADFIGLQHSTRHSENRSTVKSVIHTSHMITILSDCTYSVLSRWCNDLNFRITHFKWEDLSRKDAEFLTYRRFSAVCSGQVNHVPVVLNLPDYFVILIHQWIERCWHLEQRRETISANNWNTFIKFERENELQAPRNQESAKQERSWLVTMSYYLFRTRVPQKDIFISSRRISDREGERHISRPYDCTSPLMVRLRTPLSSTLSPC